MLWDRTLFFPGGSLCEEVGKEAGCGLYHLRTGTLGIIGGGALLGLRIVFRRRGLETEELGTDERAVFLLEAFGELLHARIVIRFAFAVGGIGGTGLQAGEHEKSASCTTGLAHTPYAATKTGRHAEGLIGREAVEVGKGSHDGLRTIIAGLEKFYGTLYSVFVHRKCSFRGWKNWAGDYLLS